MADNKVLSEKTTSETVYLDDAKKLAIKAGRQIEIDDDGAVAVIPEKIKVFPFKTNRSIGMKGETHVVAKKSKYTGCLNIKMRFGLRNETENWGGAYINPILEVNGVKYDAGNEGYDGGVMALRARIIGTARSEFYFDPRWLNIDINEEYDMTLYVFFRPYNGPLWLNRSRNQNREFHEGMPDIANMQSQNYSLIVVEEIPEFEFIN